MEEQVTDLEEEVIITNNKPLFQFSVHNKDLLVLKQWKSTWPVCRKYTLICPYSMLQCCRRLYVVLGENLDNKAPI